MRIFLSVFAKEILDNFRDRRTLVSALIMGPLFGPMLWLSAAALVVATTLVTSNGPATPPSPPMVM